MSLVDGEKEIPYGKRLLPQIVDQEARHNQDKLAGMIARSSDFTEGFQYVTFGMLANAVNRLAWWIEEKMGRSKSFETIAYLVRISRRATRTVD